MLLALDPGSFVGREPFIEDVTACAETLRSSPPVDPDRPVLVPGDVENQQRRRRRGAVPVDVAIWRRLGELADRPGTVTEPRRLDETPL